MKYIQFAASLPTEWIENYIATFEAGRVQKHPHARFVNARGECCIVAALVAARSSADVVSSEAWYEFRGTRLEALSRGFESRALTGQDFYEVCLLLSASRRAVAAAAAAEVEATAVAGM